MANVPHVRLDHWLAPSMQVDDVRYCAKDGQPWPCDTAVEQNLGPDGKPVETKEA